MKVFLGSDHQGFELKEYIKFFLKELKYEILDFGTYSTKPTDYPFYAQRVGEAIMRETGNFGILCCYTGIGMSIAANKVTGIRAALCEDVEKARLSREHNDANVLALGACNYITEEKLDGNQLGQCKEIIKIWLNTPFSSEIRHIKRLEQILYIECPELNMPQVKKEDKPFYFKD